MLYGYIPIYTVFIDYFSAANTPWKRTYPASFDPLLSYKPYCIKAIIPLSITAIAINPVVILTPFSPHLKLIHSYTNFLFRNFDMRSHLNTSRYKTMHAQINITNPVRSILYLLQFLSVYPQINKKETPIDPKPISVSKKENKYIECYIDSW
jgi:hypothetical protein